MGKYLLEYKNAERYSPYNFEAIDDLQAVNHAKSILDIPRKIDSGNFSEFGGQALYRIEEGGCLVRVFPTREMATVIFPLPNDQISLDNMEEFMAWVKGAGGEYENKMGMLQVAFEPLAR